MAYLTSERIEEWREEAQFQHDRYQRDGTGIGTVLALTQARLLRALTELSSRCGTDGCSAAARNEALVSHGFGRSRAVDGRVGDGQGFPEPLVSRAGGVAAPPTGVSSHRRI